MSVVSCEQVCVSAMTVADGRPSELSTEQIDTHLRGCAECRREVESLRALTLLLDRHKRRPHSGDVWPAVAARLLEAAPGSGVTSARGAFFLLGLVMMGYRLLGMLPERSPGLFLKVIPVFLAVAMFAYLRENPFRINPELRLEGAKE
jgi:predicted anti-sigma-YlaC factor YlaD